MKGLKVYAAWKKRRLAIGIFAALFCMAFCHGIAANTYESGNWILGGLVQFRLNSKPISAGLVEQMMQGEETEGQESRFTAWGQHRGVTVENRGLGRKTEMDLLFYFGHNTPPFELNLVNGIALSADQAYGLCGTYEAIGETVFIGGQEYVVERLLPSAKGMGIARLGRYTEETFPVLNLWLEEGSPLDESASRIASGYGIGNSLTIHYDEYLEAARRAGALPSWIFAAMLSAGLLRKAFHRPREGMVLTVFWLALAWLVLWGCSRLFVFPVGLPQAFIPTRWSDFSFWGRAISQMIQQYRLLSSMEEFIFDSQIKTLLIRIFVWNLLSHLFFVAAARQAVNEMQKRGKTNGVHIIEACCEKVFGFCGGSKGC